MLRVCECEVWWVLDHRLWRSASESSRNEYVVHWLWTSLFRRQKIGIIMSESNLTWDLAWTRVVIFNDWDFVWRMKIPVWERVRLWTVFACCQFQMLCLWPIFFGAVCDVVIQSGAECQSWQNIWSAVSGYVESTGWDELDKSEVISGMCVRFPNERTQHDVLHWRERVLNNWIQSMYHEDGRHLVITTRLTLQGRSDDTPAYYWKHGVLGRIKEFPLDRIFQKIKSSMTHLTEDTQRCIVFFPWVIGTWSEASTLM